MAGLTMKAPDEREECRVNRLMQPQHMSAVQTYLITTKKHLILSDRAPRVSLMLQAWCIRVCTVCTIPVHIQADFETMIAVVLMPSRRQLDTVLGEVDVTVYACDKIGSLMH